jgi:2'-deoxynucleoside 5'-phosphate N-hydrolase
MIKMNIYFAGSIRGGREDVLLYVEIVKILNTYGEVLTEHVANPRLGVLGEEDPVQEIYKRDMKWLASSDVLIAEVTIPSLGVGYEIAKAESLNIPVLCLFRPESGRSLSPMISGAENLHVHEYKQTEELNRVFNKFFGDKS